MLGELDDGRYQNTRVVGRRERYEPAMVLSVRVLGGTGLARDVQYCDPRCSRGAFFHHADEGHAKLFQLRA